MKNLFLSRIDRTDRLYHVVARLPRPLRYGLIKTYTASMNRRIQNRGFPDRLTIFLTNQCNMRCSHCFIVKKDQKKGWELGVEEYRTFFTKARGRLSQVLFTGGEATLRRDFADILILAGTAGGCVSASIFTNGLLRGRLLEIISRVLKETSLVLSLQFSIDGLEPFHDRNRGIDGAMKKTLSAIDAVLDIRRHFPKRFARIAVATAISKKNIDDLSSIIARVQRTGLLHSFGFVRGSISSVFNLKYKEELSGHEPVDFKDYLTVQDMEKALEIIDKFLWSKHRHNLYYATNRAILQTIRDSIEKGRPKTGCMAGLAELTLMPNGDIARCEMLRSCANLKDFNWDIGALVASEKFRNNYKKTYSCWCTHECAVGTSIMYDADLLKDVFDIYGAD